MTLLSQVLIINDFLKLQIVEINYLSLCAGGLCQSYLECAWIPAASISNFMALTILFILLKMSRTKLIYSIAYLGLLSVIMVGAWLIQTDLSFIFLVYILAFIGAVIMLFLSVILMLPASLIQGNNYLFGLTIIWAYIKADWLLFSAIVFLVCTVIMFLIFLKAGVDAKFHDNPLISRFSFFKKVRYSFSLYVSTLEQELTNVPKQPASTYIYWENCFAATRAKVAWLRTGYDGNIRVLKISEIVFLANKYFVFCWLRDLLQRSGLACRWMQLNIFIFNVSLVSMLCVGALYLFNLMAGVFNVVLPEQFINIFELLAPISLISFTLIVTLCWFRFTSFLNMERLAGHWFCYWIKDVRIYAHFKEGYFVSFIRLVYEHWGRSTDELYKQLDLCEKSNVALVAFLWKYKFLLLPWAIVVIANNQAATSLLIAYAISRRPVGGNSVWLHYWLKIFGARFYNFICTGSSNKDPKGLIGLWDLFAVFVQASCFISIMLTVFPKFYVFNFKINFFYAYSENLLAFQSFLYDTSPFFIYISIIVLLVALVSVAVIKKKSKHDKKGQ